MAEEKQPETPNPAGASSSAALQGQITTPNPLELFWEKNKSWIVGGGLVLILMIAATYVMRYLDAQRRNETWMTFFESAEFRAAIAEPAMPFGGGTSFDGWLDEQTVEGLEDAVQKLEGTRAEPWALWALASRYAREGNPEQVEQTLAQLRGKAPEFPGLQKQEAPPVYRPEPEPEEDAEPGAKPERPPLPEAKSPADVMLEMARENAGLRGSMPKLFAAPEPTSPETVVFVTSEGEFSVRLYSKRAPKSVERFLQNVREKKYDGLRFHRIVRRTEKNDDRAELLYFGDPESKNENTEKWGSFASEDKLTFEDSEVSHFPLMLSWDRASDQKDNDQQVFCFTMSDAARQRDGEYTVFGRVVSGEEVLRKIHEGELSNTSEEESGDGKPRRPVLVTELRIEGA